MSNIIWAILPLVLMIIFYVLIFIGKGEFDRVRKTWLRYDWITFFSVIFGSIILSSAVRTSGNQFPAVPLLIVTTLVLTVGITIALVRRSRTGRPVIKTMGDERTEVIFAKSSRNAFFTTYFTLFIHLFISDESMLDETWMLIVLASGLFVLIVSLPFYYFKKT